MYFGVYTLLCWLLFLSAGPVYLLFTLCSGKKISGIKARLGFFPFHESRNINEKRIWFHAASVGEVQVAKALISWVNESIPDAFFIITTVTEQGQKVALKQLPSQNTFCTYAPLDLPWIIKRFIRKIRPTVYVCLETELWPNMIITAADSGIGLLLLNGRISRNSLRNYLKIRPLIQKILGNFSKISVIMPHDRQRFIALGANSDQVFVNGNAKYDVLANHHNPTVSKKCSDNAQKKPQSTFNDQHEISKKYRQQLNIDQEQPVLIAGSTHNEEEEILIEVYKRLKNEIKNLLLILAPRHTKRTPIIEELLIKHKLPYCKKSLLLKTKRHADVVIIDTIGELASLYSIGKYVFCGGSLVPKGGHNVMEPARWGIPPVYGPYLDDFKDAKTMLESVDAGFTVINGDELYEKILFWHQHSDMYQKASTEAHKIAALQHGSARKQASLIQEIIFSHDESVRLRHTRTHTNGTAFVNADSA